MSGVMRLNQQLHQLSSESRQGAVVLSLIAGTAPGTDKEITEIVAAVTRAVDQSVQALQVASARCTTYADHV
jgi:hypothetical protein